MKSTIQGVLFAVAIATLGAGAVGTACAQSAPAAGTAPPQPTHFHGHFRHFGGSRFLGSLLRATRQLNLTPDQEKHWFGFSSSMHYLGHNGAERLNLRMERAKRDPPDDIIEQMRNESQFLIDRAADQRNVADAAEPLFSSLDDKQKQVFIEEMVRLSHERGLD